jgi:hypothetical protein
MQQKPQTLAGKVSDGFVNRAVKHVEDVVTNPSGPVSGSGIATGHQGDFD